MYNDMFISGTSVGRRGYLTTFSCSSGFHAATSLKSCSTFRYIVFRRSQANSTQIILDRVRVTHRVRVTQHSYLLGTLLLALVINPMESSKLMDFTLREQRMADLSTKVGSSVGDRVLRADSITHISHVLTFTPRRLARFRGDPYQENYIITTTFKIQFKGSIKLWELWEFYPAGSFWKKQHHNNTISLADDGTVQVDWLMVYLYSSRHWSPSHTYLLAWHGSLGSCWCWPIHVLYSLGCPATLHPSTHYSGNY